MLTFTSLQAEFSYSDRISLIQSYCNTQCLIFGDILQKFANATGTLLLGVLTKLRPKGTNFKNGPIITLYYIVLYLLFLIKFSIIIMGLMLFEMLDSDWSLSISEASASFMSSHIHFYDA